MFCVVGLKNLTLRHEEIAKIIKPNKKQPATNSGIQFGFGFGFYSVHTAACWFTTYPSQPGKGGHWCPRGGPANARVRPAPARADSTLRPEGAARATGAAANRPPADPGRRADPPPAAAASNPARGSLWQP